MVNSNGFNDKAWMDARGHPQSEALRVQERFHRRDFGHLKIEATIEDPNTLTKPVTVKFTELLIPNSDALENFCAEGERDRPTCQPLFLRMFETAGGALGSPWMTGATQSRIWDYLHRPDSICCSTGSRRRGRWLGWGRFRSVRIHYTELMIELSIDHPVPELIAAEDAFTLRAIDEGIAQLDGGQGIPLEELRQELARRCSK